MLTMLQLLIPFPPSEAEREEELKQIQAQYKRKKAPDDLQEVLDADMSLLFNLVLLDAGLPDQYEAIDRLADEIVPEIMRHKEYFNVERPHVLAQRKGVPFAYDYLHSAQTPSYPSGHTTQAYYIAHKLAARYPKLRTKLFEVAQLVADSRIDRGVHFPSDNRGGKLLASKLA